MCCTTKVSSKGKMGRVFNPSGHGSILVWLSPVNKADRSRRRGGARAHRHAPRESLPPASQACGAADVGSAGWLGRSQESLAGLVVLAQAVSWNTAKHSPPRTEPCRVVPCRAASCVPDSEPWHSSSSAPKRTPTRRLARAGGGRAGVATARAPVSAARKTIRTGAACWRPSPSVVLAVRAGMKTRTCLADFCGLTFDCSTTTRACCVWRNKQTNGQACPSWPLVSRHHVQCARLTPRTKGRAVSSAQHD